MDIPISSRRDKLQRISHVAQNIQLLCNPQHAALTQNIASTLSKTNPRSITFEPLPGPLNSIPPTKSILPVLEEIGVPTFVAQQISEVYLKASIKLHNACEVSYRSALRDSSEKGFTTAEDVRSILEIWTAVYAQQTAIWAESTISRARDMVTNLRPSNASRKKPLFNHEYTPLLEKYFEYNAYPSAPDREVLARKSMMTARQIEVWFQNHRNRARKDGRPLRNMKSDPLPVKLSLESLQQTMPLYTAVSNKHHSLSQDVTLERIMSEVDVVQMNSYCDQRNKLNPLNPPAPPHAFPMIFPPSCDYEPFPTGSDMVAFPIPVWQRRPVAFNQPHPDANIDSLISDFATKLVLRDAPSHTIQQTRTPVGSRMKQPWFAATHTRPCPAPHPALVCAVAAAKLQPGSLTPTITSPPTHTLQPSSPPIQTTSYAPHRRFTRERTPKSSRMAHREVNTFGSDTLHFTSSRSSSRSRASSVSSDDSCLRRPSSPSSVSSPVSSALTTPDFCSTPLPESDLLSISKSGGIFQDAEDLLYNSLNLVPPLEGLGFLSHTGFTPIKPTKDSFQSELQTHGPPPR